MKQIADKKQSTDQKPAEVYDPCPRLQQFSLSTKVFLEQPRHLFHYGFKILTKKPFITKKNYIHRFFSKTIIKVLPESFPKPSPNAVSTHCFLAPTHKAYSQRPTLFLEKPHPDGWQIHLSALTENPVKVLFLPQCFHSLNSKAFTTLLSSPPEHLLSRLCLHASPEAMSSFSWQVVRLISSFHVFYSFPALNQGETIVRVNYIDNLLVKSIMITPHNQNRTILISQTGVTKYTEHCNTSFRIYHQNLP